MSVQVESPKQWKDFKNTSSAKFFVKTCSRTIMRKVRFFLRKENWECRTHKKTWNERKGCYPHSFQANWSTTWGLSYVVPEKFQWYQKSAVVIHGCWLMISNDYSCLCNHSWLCNYRVFTLDGGKLVLKQARQYLPTFLLWFHWRCFKLQN